MSTLVQDVLNEVAELIGDIANTTWTTAFKLKAFNDAQKSAVAQRPDTNSVRVPHLCVAGTHQRLIGPADLRILRVTRNMGVNGTTPGNSILLVDWKQKDRFEPDWHTAVTNAVVQEWMYDPTVEPQDFWLSPPIPATPVVQVELYKSVSPAVTLVADLGTATVEIEDIYIPALREWMQYYCYSRDDEETPNWQRAQFHLQNFYNFLGIKLQADIVVNPKNRRSNQNANEG